MQGYYFTDDLRQVLAGAREQARRLNHEYVGTEHVLLAYAVDAAPSAARLLRQLNLDGATVRAAVEEVVRPGEKPPEFVEELPYTSKAKKSLEDALSVARELGHNFVGIEHMLAGLLRGRTNIAAQVLALRGVTDREVIAVAASVPMSSSHRSSPQRPSLLARVWRRLRRQS